KDAEGLLFFVWGWNDARWAHSVRRTPIISLWSSNNPADSQFEKSAAKDWRSRDAGLVLPPGGGGHVGAFRGDEFGDFLDADGLLDGAHPAMRLADTVNEETFVVRVLGGFHPVLEFADGDVELVGVHGADVYVEFVHELGAEGGPVSFEVFEQVGVVFPILGDGGIDFAGALVEERLEVAVGAERAEDGGPDVELVAGAAVGAGDEFEVIALLGGEADAAIGFDGIDGGLAAPVVLLVESVRVRVSIDAFDVRE